MPTMAHRSSFLARSPRFRPSSPLPPPLQSPDNGVGHVVCSEINRSDQVGVGASAPYRATPVKLHGNLAVLVHATARAVRVLQEKTDSANSRGHSAEGGVQVVYNLLPQRPANGYPFQSDVQLHGNSSSLSFDHLPVSE